MSYWNEVKPIKYNNYTIHGYSKAAKNTCFYIPELKIMLDAGLEHNYIPDHIFITHCHADHIKDLPLNIIQLGNYKNKSLKKINIYVPEEMIEKVQNYIDSFFIMSKNNPNQRTKYKYNLIGVKPNSRIEVLIKNTKYIVEIIKCDHTVPCVGYGFIEIRNKLKDIYKNLNSKEIIEIKKDHIITEELEVPHFCYLGDSSELVFDEKEIIKYNFIMTEYSFINNLDLGVVAQAKQKKHVLFDNIEQMIRNNPNKTYLLYHFSDRYRNDEIKQFFNSKNIDNIILWI